MGWFGKCSLFGVLCVLVALNQGVESHTIRTKRGAAYAGAHGTAVPKLSPSVALGTYGQYAEGGHGGYRKQSVQEVLGSYGGFTSNRHGYGGKLTVQEALGTYGSKLSNPHPSYQGKQTVQEALGAYGPYAEGGHRIPTVLGSGGSLFNKH